MRTVFFLFAALRATTVYASTASSEQRPCDIYAASGSPCGAAHSVTRALFFDYTGPLYQLQRSSPAETLDISPDMPGGVANADVYILSYF